MTLLANSKLRLLIAAVLIGAVNAVIFKVFEFVVNEGSEFIWNDLFNSDQIRWLVVPLAIIFSVGFSWLMKALKQPRWVKPETDLFAPEKESKKPTTLTDIGKILLTGGSSLLAGASLGPEMALTDSSKAIGKWTAAKAKAGPAAGLLVAMSVGALMVSFFGSMILVLLPIFLIYKQTKKVPLAGVLPIVISGLSAYGTLWLMDRHDMGYQDVPVIPDAHLWQYLTAMLVALCVSVFAFGLVRLIGWLGDRTREIDLHFPWYISAAVFGLALGVLYIFGGESVQFSGSAGTKILLEQSASYGTWAFLGLAIIKLLSTAWSKTIGYRGGLFFPSVYASVAIGLFIGSLEGALTGGGGIIGAIAGIFAALSGSAVFAALTILAIIPIKLSGVAIVAIIAGVAGNRLLQKLFP